MIHTKTLAALAAGTALAMMAGSAVAADLARKTVPVAAPAATAAQWLQFAAVFEVGGSFNRITQTDDDVSKSADGIYGAGSVTAKTLFGLGATVDLQGETRGLDTGEEAWRKTVVLGGHLNYEYAGLLAGIFGSYGWAPDYDNTFQDGTTYGVEAQYTFGQFSLFGQFGRANIRTDEDDSGFSGYFGRGGVNYQFSDALLVQLEAGRGHANKGFEDSGDWGTYTTWGAKAVYKVTDAFSVPVFATASYEGGYYKANTEDTGHEHIVRLGVAVPLGVTGAGPSLRAVANPLATATTPYRAASWGETLD